MILWFLFSVISLCIDVLKLHMTALEFDSRMFSKWKYAKNCLRDVGLTDRFKAITRSLWSSCHVKYQRVLRLVNGIFQPQRAVSFLYISSRSSSPYLKIENSLPCSEHIVRAINNFNIFVRIKYFYFPYRASLAPSPVGTSM